MTNYLYGSKFVFTDRNNSQTNQIFLTGGKNEGLVVNANDFERDINTEYISVTSTKQRFDGTNTFSFMTPIVANDIHCLVWDGAVSLSYGMRYYQLVSGSWTLIDQKSYSSGTQRPDAAAMNGNYMCFVHQTGVGAAAFFNGSVWVTNYVGTSLPNKGNHCDIWSDGRIVSAVNGSTTLQTNEPNGSNNYPNTTTDFTIEAIEDVSINDKYIITAHANNVVIRNRSTPTTKIKTITISGVFRVFSNASYIGFATSSKIYLYTNVDDAQLIAEFDTGITLNYVNCSQEANGLICYCSTSSLRFIKYEPTLGFYVDQGSTRALSDSVDSSSPSEFSVMSVPNSEYVVYTNNANPSLGSVNMRKLSTVEESTRIGKIEILDNGKLDIESYGEITMKSSLASEPNVVNVEGTLKAEDFEVTNGINYKNRTYGITTGSTAQTIPNDTLTTLTNWTTPATNGNISYSSGVFTITDPVTKVYNISASAYFNASSGGNRRSIVVEVNGTEIFSARMNPVDASVSPGNGISGNLLLSNGDTVEVSLYQNTGGDLDASAKHFSVVEL